MRLRPIPRSVLPHSVTYRTPAEGEYGGEFSDEQEIGNVRFTSAAELMGSEYVLSDGAKGVLYVDARNSTASGDLPVGSIVALNGEDHFVTKCTPCLAFGEIHHWELELA